MEQPTVGVDDGLLAALCQRLTTFAHVQRVHLYVGGPIVLLETGDEFARQAISRWQHPEPAQLPSAARLAAAASASSVLLTAGAETPFQASARLLHVPLGLDFAGGDNIAEGWMNRVTSTIPDGLTRRITDLSYWRSVQMLVCPENWRERLADLNGLQRTDFQGGAVFKSQLWWNLNRLARPYNPVSQQFGQPPSRY